ncbi:MAG: hypothetical protein ABIQ02_06170, partial [Saprospiraceae bacterium]
MKNLTFSNFGTILMPTSAMRYLLFTAFLLLCTQLSVLQAQASLSIQGILKKSNGVAVEDGIYNVTFKLYTAPNGGTAIWTETQSS